jgi:hypothetical protein
VGYKVNGHGRNYRQTFLKPASALGTLVVSLLEFRVSRLNLLTKTTRWKTMFTCHQQPLPQETERTHGYEPTHGTESDLALWSAHLSLVGIRWLTMQQCYMLGDKLSFLARRCSSRLV